jgi:RNA polymerase sigma factor (sigma-70 family)
MRKFGRSGRESYMIKWHAAENDAVGVVFIMSGNQQVQPIAIAPQQLGQWFDAYAARMVLYARQWVTQALAEDLVQDVFARLAGQRVAPVNVKAWLLTCVRNAALDAIKSARRRSLRDAGAGREQARAFQQRPDDLLDATEVEGMLHQLTPQRREIITLKIWGEATFGEIAAIVGLPLSSVYVHYKAGLCELKAGLENPCRKN